jgi:hypothetical protein
MKIRRIVSVLALCLLSSAAPAGAGHTIQSGDALLKMCLGADKLKSLAMMCHNYLNGYIDAALFFGKGGKFCLGAGDKERLPTVVVTWLNAHPEYLKKPAPEALVKVLAENYPCRK